MTTLDKIPLNTTYKIKNLNCSGNIQRRLLDLGLIEDTSIKASFRSPLGDPTAYEVRGSTIALRKEDSQMIEVYWI